MGIYAIYANVYLLPSPPQRVRAVFLRENSRVHFTLPRHRGRVARKDACGEGAAVCRRHGTQHVPSPAASCVRPSQGHKVIFTTRGRAKMKTARRLKAGE